MKATCRERLDFWSCFFLKNGSYVGFKGTYENGKLVKNETCEVYCKIHGAFIVSDNKANCHATFISLCILIILFGLVGIITNILNVHLHRKLKIGKHLKESLVVLSAVELVLSLTTTMFAFLALFIRENIERGQVTLILFVACSSLFNCTRSMSVHLTVFITIHRYVVIAFPVKSLVWLKTRKPRVIMASFLIYAVILKLPWLYKAYVGANDYYRNDDDKNSEAEKIVAPEEMLGFPYFIKRNGYGRILNKGIEEALMALDLVAPFFIIFTFNTLFYRSIRKWSKTGKTSVSSHNRYVRISKMFSAVMVLVTLSNSVAAVIFYTSKFHKVIYVELFLLQRLSVAMLTSGNFVIYYWFFPSYKKDFWVMLDGWFIRSNIRVMRDFVRKQSNFAIAQESIPATEDNAEKSENDLPNGESLEMSVKTKLNS